MGGIVLAAIDIHKAVFQAAVVNRANGEIRCLNTPGPASAMKVMAA